METLKYVCVLLMILLSGAIRFYLEWGIIFIPLMLLFGIWLFLRTEEKQNNILNALIILLYPLINVLVINPDLTSNFAYSCLLILASGFFIISSFEFVDFREKWLQCVKWLCIISIPIQVLHDIGLIPTGGTDIRGNLTTLFFFNCDWGFSRLSSIYWECGQFQIVLIYTLLMFTDELVQWNNYQLLIKKFGVIVFALLMTQSTTGYICLMLLVASLFVFSQNGNMSRRNKILLMFPLLMVFFVIVNSSAIQEKILQSQNTEIDNKSSTAIRLQDNLALIDIILESPYVGFGLETARLADRQYYNDSITSSNGWLYSTASLGAVYVLVFILLMYFRIRENLRGIPALIILGICFVSQCNEYIIFLPYMLPFLYEFRSEWDETYDYEEI